MLSLYSAIILPHKTLSAVLTIFFDFVISFQSSIGVLSVAMDVLVAVDEDDEDGIFVPVPVMLMMITPTFCHLQHRN